jgi:death-on-curing protein
MKFKYISLEEILRLHYQVIEDFGGSHGIHNEGRLSSIVKAPAQIVFGEEQYPTIFDKGAVYLRNIVGDHPFTDGNKRTAITVSAIFLMRNGYNLTVSANELEDFTINVATQKLTIDQISSWLEDNTLKILLK